jgi:glycerol-3-phosphate dehydrogenase
LSVGEQRDWAVLLMLLHADTKPFYLNRWIFPREKVLALADENSQWDGWLSEKLKIYKSQVIWAVRREWARTVEDVLARRTRALFLDARESVRIAPIVAGLMAKELNKDKEWVSAEINNFNSAAKNYYFEE